MFRKYVKVKNERETEKCDNEKKGIRRILPFISR
jgi:hypothetical protein